MSAFLSFEGQEIEVDLYISETTGRLTLHIDTIDIPDTAYGPDLRIVLNDDFEDPIWDGRDP
jgi:hypothetical protein